MSPPILYQKLLTRIQALQDMHYNCSEIYSNFNIYLFAPSVTITTLSSIASFLTASEYITTDMKSVFSIIVGILTIISAMLQSFTNTLKYPAKMESHQLAADEYSKLLTKLQFEYINPNEDNFFENIESKILEIKNNCKYYPPQTIVNKYREKLSLENFTNEVSEKLRLI
jgi:hypothetical protein